MFQDLWKVGRHMIIDNISNLKMDKVYHLFLDFATVNFIVICWHELSCVIFGVQISFFFRIRFVVVEIELLRIKLFLELFILFVSKILDLTTVKCRGDWYRLIITLALKLLAVLLLVLLLFDL